MRDRGWGNWGAGRSGGTASDPEQGKGPARRDDLSTQHCRRLFRHGLCLVPSRFHSRISFPALLFQGEMFS